MKRIVAQIIAVFIFVGVSISASAAGMTRFYAECNTEIDNSRLFCIDLYAQCDELLSAAVITVNYDSSMIEYRDISAASGEAQAKSDGSSVKIVYANPSGANVADSGKILSIKFKSLQSGVFDIDISCSEAVSQSYEYLNIGECTGCEITINGKTVTSTSKKSGKTTVIKGERSSVSEKEINDENGTAVDSLFADVKDNYWIYFLVGAGTVVLVVLFIFAGIIIGVRFRSDSKGSSENDVSNKKNNDEDNNCK